MRIQQCVDASFMVALLMPESFSTAALALWQAWVANDDQLVAPLLMRYEVTSALYRKSLCGLVSVADARAALGHFLKMDIAWLDLPDLPVRATRLAEQFQRPNTYDTHYLALAEGLNISLWTADERLYNAVRSGFPLIHWLGN